MPVPFDRGLSALAGRESLASVRESRERRAVIRRVPCARCRDGLPDVAAGPAVEVWYCLACRRQSVRGRS